MAKGVKAAATVAVAAKAPREPWTFEQMLFPALVVLSFGTRYYKVGRGGAGEIDAPFLLLWPFFRPSLRHAHRTVRSWHSRASIINLITSM